jgi:putative membrane protein
MRTTQLFLAGLLALGISAGCDTTGTTADPSPARRGETSLAAADENRVGEDDAKAMFRIGQNSLGVVVLGRLAAEKASDTGVKGFAKRVQAAHNDLNVRMDRLAKSKGIDLARELSDGDQRELNRLKKLSGKAFDQAYVDAMIHNFSAIANTMHEEAKRGGDPDLREFCANNEAVVRERNQAAKALKAELAK